MDVNIHTDLANNSVLNVAAGEKRFHSLFRDIYTFTISCVTEI